MKLPPSRLICETYGFVDHGCPKVGCPNRLRDGAVCSRIVEDLMQAADRGEAWGLDRTQANVAWALSLDSSRVGQIERGALEKLRVALAA